ncbi:hypothetical protein PPACK8108_LOCUS21628 [Phakopsora pachyrhizi]|uniref:Uncharacterized protein n=1 Tax=Phakopsora pachyrhizi TaxID=170000 RepID=A0AAV0BMW8_PHAPC|nr:hypothetical protein PPACK8108_LOCUS21628 [Phakopsora pachyrhizi]
MLSDWHHINASDPPSLTNNVRKDYDCEEERDYHSLPHDQIEYGPIYNPVGPLPLVPAYQLLAYLTHQSID